MPSRLMPFVGAIVLALFVALSLPPPSATAQNAEATRLLERGMTLRRSGDDAGALALFERAVAIQRTGRAIAQVGLAHHALGHYLVARTHLLEALAMVRDTWVQTRRAALEEGLRDCEAHLATLSIEGGLNGDAVFVNGQERGVLPLSEPIYTEPGDAEISLRRGATVVAVETVILEAGVPTPISFVANAPAPAAAAEIPLVAPLTSNTATTSATTTAPTSTTDTSLLPILGYTSLGLGVAGFATGIAFHVLRENAAADFNDTCPDASAALVVEGCAPLQQRGTRYQNAAIAGYAVGGALLVTGVVLLLLPRPSSSTDTAAIDCAPLLGTTTGVACGGLF